MLGLIQRLYAPQEGELTLSSVDCQQIHLHQWRNAVGTVQQTCPLLSGTIAENMAYSVAEPVTQEALVAAARQAGIYDFIMTLPQGFDTQVGQLGDKLSGGQRQRISVARMILKNPRILLLDEPTSSLDNENAALVTSSLSEVARGKTTVIVAHDIRSIRSASHIIVLNNGCVETEGTSEEVYAASETFRNYCMLQKEEDK